MTRKTFERGELVEIQTEPGGRWIRGRYRERWTATSEGAHVVDPIQTYHIVPSRRIRKRTK